jgi:hypothetical protein
MKKNTTITKGLGLAGLFLALMTGSMNNLAAQSEEREARRDDHIQDRHTERVQDTPQARRPDRERERPRRDAAPARAEGHRGDQVIGPRHAPSDHERPQNAPNQRADRPTENRERPQRDAAPARAEGRRGGQGMRPSNTPNRDARPDSQLSRRDAHRPGNMGNDRQSDRRGPAPSAQQRGPQRNGPPWMQGRGQSSRGNGPFQMRRNRPGSAFRSMQARHFGPMQRGAMMRPMQHSQRFRALQAERGRPGQDRRSLDRGPSKRGRDTDGMRSHNKRDDHKGKNLKSREGKGSRKHGLKERGRGQDHGKSNKKNLRHGKGAKKGSKDKAKQKQQKNRRNHHSPRR